MKLKDIKLKDLEKPVVFFDLETTGLDVDKDRIVQMAFLKIFPNGKIEKHKWLVDPEMIIPQESIDVHGITNARVEGEFPLHSFREEIRDIMLDSIIAGYNVRKYDIPLLVNDMIRSTGDDPSEWMWIYESDIFDVFELYKDYRQRTLIAAYKDIVGDDEYSEDAHDAFADTVASAKVAVELLKRTDEALTQAAERVKPEGFCDFAGKLRYKDGQVVYNFGKHKDKPVVDHPDYAKWMILTDFPEETKSVLRGLLANAQ